MNRSMHALLAILAMALSALVVASPALGAFGVKPGSFLAKTHETIPLVEVSPGSEASAFELRSIDMAALADPLLSPPVSQAGAHPDASVNFTLNHTGSIEDGSGDPEGNIKDARVDAPPGFLGDPEAVPPCSREAFEVTYQGSGAPEPKPDGCSPASQVGVARVMTTVFTTPTTVPVYRLTASHGSPATFGFPIKNFGILINPRLRSDGDYGVTFAATDISDIPVRLLQSTVTLWGVPSDPIHNPERWDGETASWGASATQGPRPFLSNPTYCDSGPLETRIEVDSWAAIGQWLPEDPADPDYAAAAPEPTGCDQLEFGGPTSPVSLAFRPALRAADTPSGYEATLTLPYNQNPDQLANPTLRHTEVALPEGVLLNPAAAAGLAACTSEQIGFLGSGFPLPNPIRFDSEPPRCPDASKIAAAQVTSPLLEEPLQGAVYLAKQLDNPFGSPLAIYIVIDDVKTGLRIKLAGRVRTDPGSGRVTSTFENSPQLPFTEFDLGFFGGPRAPLANPGACGAKTTSTVLTPWSAPHTPAVTSQDSFTIDSGPNGSPCAASGAQAPNTPSFEAGAVTPLGGIYSPFALKLKRRDGSQELRALDLELPPGLTGRLAGVERCSEAAIAQAKARAGLSEGALEQSAPSCPAASRLGSVEVAAGVGSSPLHVPGTVYLAGPYKGAPLSVAIITPAVAGPFDLGVVLVRAALHVDPRSTQITAKSDPIPDILRVAGNGFPLKVRSVVVEMDRPDFTRNPTSCNPMAVKASAFAAFSTALLRSPFQLGGCRALEFAPKLNLRLFGGVKRAKYQRLRAILQAAPGEANISRTSVRFPSSAFLAQEHIGTVCTRVQFAAGQCPEKSVYGRATAWSPLLDAPLSGAVVLRSSDNLLPDLVADLRGPAELPLKVELVGRTDSVKGALRSTFDVVPDAPVSKFVLELFGGKRGLIVNSRSICQGVNRATVKMDAHNGGFHDFRPRVWNSRCSKQAEAKKRGPGKAAPRR